MIRRLLPATVLPLILASFVAAAEPTAEPAPLELTLEDAVHRALAKNFDLQIQTDTTAIAQAAINVNRADFDPTISLTASTDFTRTASASSQLDGSSRPESENDSARLAVNQRLVSGATATFSTRLARNETNSTFSTINPIYNSDASLTLSQPLLRGAGLTINRAQIRRAQLGLDRANIDYRARALDVIRDTENAYHNLAFARQQLDVRDLSLALAQRLFDEAKTRRETGVATDLDVLQAEVGVANARRAVLQARQALRDRSDGLLALIGQFEFARPVAAAPLAPYREPPPSLDASFARARLSQPDYLSLQKGVEQIEIDLRLAKNARRANLAVGGIVGLNNRDGSGGPAYRDLIDANGYNWQLNLSLSFPWGFRGDTARLHQTEATLRREQNRLRQFEQNILVQVRTAVRSVETNIESVAISELASQLSARQYELEKARFDAGLSTSRRVLEAQTDLETARVNELQARVTLRTSLAALHRLEGSSLEAYRVELP